MSKIFFASLLAVVIVYTSQIANAQSQNSVAGNPTLTTTVPGALDNPSVVGGLKSWNDSGRVRELQDPKGRFLKSKNEYFLGGKSEKGWGVYGQGVEYVRQYGNTVKNTVNPGDPSVTLMHPDLYNEGRLRVWGQFREYFPVSDFSVNRSQWQQAYYSRLLFKMRKNWDIYNEVIPRYFSQSYYQANDTTFYSEDLTTLSHKQNSWFRYGLGQHSQVEFHPGTPTGNCVEVFPYAEFALSPTIFLSPRIYVPVAAQNSVFDGPTNVSTGNVQGEVYLQATL